MSAHCFSAGFDLDVTIVGIGESDARHVVCRVHRRRFEKDYAGDDR